MFSELRDFPYSDATLYPDYVPVYDDFSSVSSYILMGSLCFIALFTLVLRPMGWFPTVSKEALEQYFIEGGVVL